MSGSQAVLRDGGGGGRCVSLSHFQNCQRGLPPCPATAPSILVTVLIPLFSTTAHYAVISLCNFILGLKLIVNLVNWNTTFHSYSRVGIRKYKISSYYLNFIRLYSDQVVFMKQNKNIFVCKIILTFWITTEKNESYNSSILLSENLCFNFRLMKYSLPESFFFSQVGFYQIKLTK